MGSELSETRLGYQPSTRHADLGEGFYDVVAPAEFPQPVLRFRNQRWAARVGLDTLTDEEWMLISAASSRCRAT